MEFCQIVFHDIASFYGVNFQGWVIFSKSIFSKNALFTNTKFLSTVSFEGTNFTKFVPEFYETKLHHSITFHTITWPDIHKINNLVILRFNHNAYKRLTSEMNKQLRHKDELFFFAKELETKRQIYWVKEKYVAWFLNYLYYFVSNYGKSIKNAFLSTIMIWFIMLLVNNKVMYYMPELIGNNTELFTKIARYTSINFMLGGPLLQQRAVRDLFQDTDYALPPFWLDAINSFASILILICIFLIGLALRNRFRIR